MKTVTGLLNTGIALIAIGVAIKAISETTNVKKQLSKSQGKYDFILSKMYHLDTSQK